MAQTSPQLQRALEILADGKWHPYREVVSKMAAVIPPGVGARRAERVRANHARRMGYSTADQRQTPIDSVQLARVGALTMARQAINANKRLFEIKPQGQLSSRVERWVRLRSEARG